jgi:hypothetical protein
VEIEGLDPHLRHYESDTRKFEGLPDPSHQHHSIETPRAAATILVDSHSRVANTSLHSEVL